MKKILKNYSAYLISFLIIAGITVVIACSGSFLDEDDLHYRIFAPEISHNDAAKPFFRSFHYLYKERKENNINDFDSINSAEWIKFFGGAVIKSDVDFLLYNSRLGQIDSLIFFLIENNYTINSDLRKNTLLTCSDKNKIKEFLYYLGFAKRCEPYSTYAPEWYTEDDKNDPRKNKEAMTDLIDGGLKQISNSKTEFIRERYIFQIERLYFQSGNYSQCYDYYNSNKGSLKISESINNRALGFAAGSLYKMKRFGESNYLFSLLYDRYAPMRTTAYFGFSPKEESDWNESLNLARNTREKEVLWQLLGIYKDPLRSMKEIYRIDPKSDLLDLLLARSVSTAEESFMPLRDSDTQKLNEFRIINEKVSHDLISFIKACSDKGNTNKPYLWDLAAGYLSFAAADFGTARKYLDKTKDETKNDQLVQEQIHLIEIPMLLQQSGSIDSKFESKILNELTWLRSKYNSDYYYGTCDTFKYDGVFDWTIKRLSEKYNAQGELIKSHCLNAYDEASFYFNGKNAAAMIAYMDKKDKSDFDKFILSLYPIKQTDIYEFQAVNLMVQHRTTEAIDKFEQCPGSGDKVLAGDPFLIHINDCHDCDHDARQKTKYTKLNFVKKMAELEQKINSDPANSSAYCFELANGLYNITYFGNARLFYQTAINGYGYYSFDYEDNNSVNKNSAIFNCGEAETYYKKAIGFSKNNEFKAKCLIMAAKCEHDSFFMSMPKGFNRTFRAGSYFGLLKKSYSQTKYYKEIIRECGYFRTYLRKN